MAEVPRFLLDTHIWVWLVEGVEREIGRRARERLRRAGEEWDLSVSPISAWEVGTLVRKGRLTLSMGCRAWVDRAVAVPGIRVAALTPAIAAESTLLPGQFHGDPADRMLVATARTLGATFVTRDRRILRYARTGQLHALDATP